MRTDLFGIFRVTGLLLSVVFFNTCQYPVDPTALPDPKKYLVVEAELTENYGKVKVFYSITDLTEQGSYHIPSPPQATAYVLDGHGNRTDFSPDGKTDTVFRGVIGETYTLYVEADGKAYVSNPETMRACPAIDTLTPDYSRESARDPNDLNYDGFDVFAQLNDIPGQENYYQWDWIHYERRFSCETAEEAGRTVLIPCDPADCWGIRYNTRVVVQSDKLRDGNTIAQKVVRVPFATPPNKYYLRVEQRSITPDVFAYLQSVQTQTQHTGTLFDIPAETQFNPNVHNVNDPKEQLLGIFNVFAYRRKIIYIDMLQKIPGATAKNTSDGFPFTSSPFRKAPCVEGLYRTRIRPEGWED